MFEKWKRAWGEAVENFHRELRGGEGGPHAFRVHEMRRDVRRAREELDGLTRDLARARSRRAEARDERDVCRRREAQARRIGDERTARIAAEFAARHRARADVLGRKIEVLEDERALTRRELRAMEGALRGEGQTVVDS